MLTWAGFLLLGCGGGGGGGTGGGGGGGSNLARLSVAAAFAPPTRVVPGYADELHVSVTPPTGVSLPANTPSEFTLTRQASGRELVGLTPSAAPYTFNMEALTDGVVVGRVVRTIIVTPGMDEGIDVSAFLQSEIASIQIEGPSVVSTLQSSVQYTAHARDSLGQTLFTGAGFEWTSSIGRDLFVDADTGYAIPRFPGQSTVKATLKGTTKSDSLIVTIESGAVVTVSPSIATLQVGESSQFTATITGLPSQRVTWSVDEGAGGTVSSTGEYSTPPEVGTFHVRATAVDDPNASATATVSVRNDSGWYAVILHPEGERASEAFATSGGQQVGYVWLQSSEYMSSVWSGTRESLVGLTPPGKLYATYGVEQGGAATVIPGRGAGVWDGTTGSFVSLVPEGNTHDKSAVRGMHAGFQVGGLWSGGMSNASLWSGSAESWISLNPIGSTGGYAYGIHNGQQVGTVEIAGRNKASLWTGSAATWVNLHPLEATWSQALGVYAGVQVGDARFGELRQASMWHGSASSWENIHPSGAVESTATGIYDGDIVGWADVGAGKLAMYRPGSTGIWKNLHLLLPQGYEASWANGIARVGARTYIVGAAMLPGEPNTTHAVLWVKSR